MLRVKNPHLMVFWHLILMNLRKSVGLSHGFVAQCFRYHRGDWHGLRNVKFNENLLLQLQLFWGHSTTFGNMFKSKFEVLAPVDKHVNSWDGCLGGNWEPNLWVSTDVAYTEAGSVLRSRMNRNQHISCKKVGTRYRRSSVRPRSRVTKIAIARDLGNNSISQVD